MPRQIPSPRGQITVYVGVGFRVLDLGFRVLDLGFRVVDLGFRLWALGFRGLGLGVGFGACGCRLGIRE